MLRINLVARIAKDKNSFLDLVYVAHKLKQNNFDDFAILFIGAVESISIYQNIVRMAELLGVTSNIKFTEKSIAMTALPEDVKDGYFFNFTVGNFMGYSSVECVNLGFKTIFCNADKRLVNEQYNYINVCPDIDSVVDLILLISKDPAPVNMEIQKNNLSMKRSFLLNQEEAGLLRSWIVPAQ
ncbi:hypothetical protein [Mucilaginibacter aquariorum]|uniref:Glycosyl transferase family 1 domain-containing protein n=1 Tax=Mucilaginibacter aquariorum TaxID=2967225 RepID=A0ABT1SYY4_9SPHI|nr:hypothetical protein [Mucilaginibacter aquariorum]MCQ6957276.1 hypothetical protein [Mucilaginibacter aquariorum]